MLKHLYLTENMPEKLAVGRVGKRTRCPVKVQLLPGNKANSNGLIFCYRKQRAL